MTTPEEDFRREVEHNIAQLGADEELRDISAAWINQSAKHRYTYNFRWLGRPIIQLPADIMAMQELIWSVQPDLIIETGIAHGGSLVFSASMLELVALSGGPRDARVLGIDIDIRAHNRAAIEAHPLSGRITMLQGSSVDPDILGAVHRHAEGCERVLVMLDSNHTHEHVIAELEAYAPLTSVGSYCVVFDTVVEHMEEWAFPDRPWGRGNNPLTAVREYVSAHPEFEVDERLDHKLLLSVAPSGYLKRVR